MTRFLGWAKELKKLASLVKPTFGLKSQTYHGHQVHASLRKIIVLAESRGTRQVSISVSVRFIDLVENIIDQQAKVHFPNEVWFPRIAQAQIVYKVRLNYSLVVAGVVEILLAHIF